MSESNDNHKRKERSDEIDLKRTTSDLPPPKKRYINMTEDNDEEEEKRNQLLAAKFLVGIDDRVDKISKSFEKFSQSILEEQKILKDNQKILYKALATHHNHGVIKISEPIESLTENIISAFDRHQVLFKDRNDATDQFKEFDLIDSKQMLIRLFNLINKGDSTDRINFLNILSEVQESNPSGFTYFLQMFETINLNRVKESGTIRPVDMHKKDSLIFNKIIKEICLPPMFNC